MGDLFDEIAMQNNEVGAEDEPDFFDQFVNDEINLEEEQEDRGGDLGLPASGGDADAEGDTVIDDSPKVDKPGDLSHIPAGYRGDYERGRKSGADIKETVGETLFGETEDVPEASLHAVKRVGQSARKGTGDILEAGAAFSERDESIEDIKKHALNPVIQREATTRAQKIDPNWGRDLFWEQYQIVLDERKIEMARKFRAAKGIVGTEVEPTKFKGGWAQDIDEAAAAMAEFAPTMIVTAINAPAGVAMTFAQLFGGKYESGLQKYGNKEQAFKIALIHAAMGTPVESLGNILQLRVLGKIFKNLKIGGKGSTLTPSYMLKLLKSGGGVAQGAATEGVEEGVQAYTEAYADTVGDAPPGASPSEIYGMFNHIIGTDEFKKSRNKGIKLGALGGGMLGAGGVAAGSSVDLQRLISKKWAEFRKDPNFLKSLEIATQADLDQSRAGENVQADALKAEAEVVDLETVDTAGGLSTDTTNMERAAAADQEESLEERKAAIQSINDQRVEQIKVKEEKEAKAAEQQAKAEAEGRQRARSAQRAEYVQQVSTPEGAMEQAVALDSKPLNDAHKALSVGEDSLKKLVSLEYDLKNDRTIKESGFEYEATADAMVEHVRTRINELEAEEAQIEEDKLVAEGDKIIVKEKEAAVKEAEKAAKEAAKPSPKKTTSTKVEKPKKVETRDEAKDLFDTFAEDTKAAVKEREVEEKKEKAAEAKKAPAPKAKEPTTKKALFSGRSFGRRRSAGIGAAGSAKLDQAFAAQRAAAEKKAEAKTAPKDLKAALRLEDGTVLTGDSHYSIFENMTDEEVEKVNFEKVNRGFTSSEDAFLSVDESTAKYGVTKSQQLPSTKGVTRSTRKLDPVELEAIARKAVPTRKAALNKAQAEERVKQVPEKYMKGRKVVVVDTASELSPAVRAEMGGIGAAYHVAPGEKASEGTIYLVADKTENNLKLMINLWHEMGHQGVAKLAEDLNLGDDLSSLLTDTKKKYPQEIIRTQLMYNISEDIAAEEVLVHQFEAGNDKSLTAKFRRLLLRAVRALGIKLDSDLDLYGIVANMRLIAAGNKIRFGQKGYTEARNATADGMSTVRKALKPVMIKAAIKIGALREESVKVSEHLNEAQAIDEKLRAQIADQVFRGPDDIEQTKKDIAAGRKQPSALTKRMLEVKRAKANIAAGKEVTQSRKTNVTNYNAALRNSPALLAAVKQLEKDTGVPLLDANGDLVSAPIEQRTKPGNGRFKTLPKFGGFSRSLTQTYLDRMSAPAREAFRSDMIAYVETAFTEGNAPKTFNIGLKNIGGTKYNISSALRAANKTEGAINLNGMCPMFYVGSHGCYFDGCYVTGIGKGATNVNVHDSAIYTGEILQLDQESIDNLNEVGGLRMNGIGDTSLQDYGQWRDIFKHAAMRGLKLKIITKQEATFEILDKLMKDGDTRIAKLAGDTIVQPSLDPYWIPVEEDGRVGSFATELGLTGKPQTAEKVIELYRSIGRDAKLINGIVHRKYGFSGEQLKAIAKKYPAIKVQPRVVVGTTKEIAEFALKQPEVLQTWMHAKIRPGMYSDVHGRTLTEGEVGNFEDRIEVKKDLLGEWIIEAQEANGKVVQNDRYTAVETYIKENYSKKDATKIFETLAGQNKNASALCCSSGASKNACNDCTSTCATGTYHSGKSVEDLAIRNTEMAKFVESSSVVADATITKKVGQRTGATEKVQPVTAERAKKVNRSIRKALEPAMSLSKGQKAFLKGTTVVDENGNPLMVFHGTQADVNEFNITNDIGYHFGSPVQANIRILNMRRMNELEAADFTAEAKFADAELADEAHSLKEKLDEWDAWTSADDFEFSEEEQESLTEVFKDADGYNIIPAYLDIKNPFIMNDPGNWDSQSFATAVEKGQREIKTIGDMNGLNNVESADDIRTTNLTVLAWLKSKGYDGVQYWNDFEGAGWSYVALEANQIKSVFNINPTPKRDIRKAYEPHFVLKDVVDKQTNIQRSWLREQRRNWIDQLDILKQLEQGQDIDDTLSGYKSQTLISNAPAMIDTFLEYGNIRMVEKWMRVTNEGKGIAKLVTELGEDSTAFFERMTAKSGAELLEKFGKQNLWGQDKDGKQIDDQGKIAEIMADTQDLYEKNAEKWDGIEERLQEINGMVLDFMKDAGIISEESRSKMRETYIPFYRQIEDLFGESIDTLIPKAGKNIGTTHRLEGSEIHELGDPLGNLITGYSFFINESLRNLARVKSLKMAKELGLVKRVHKGQRGGKNVIAIRVDGEPIHYQVMNTGLYETLNQTVQTPTKVPNWLRAPKRWLTWGVTITPRFRMFNILRDTLSAAFMNKSFFPFVDTYRGFMSAARRDANFVEWTSAGGNFTGSYSKRDAVASTQKGVTKLKERLTRGKRNGLREFGSAAYKLYDRLGELSESANRMGVFLAEKRTGATVTKAAFESRDLLDFHRKGAGGIANFMIQTVPFLNARLQGLDKLARTGFTKNEHRKRFWFAATGMIMASLALHVINEDNEDYRKLSDWEKIAYWHFYVGDQHFRIPTPFEVGSIFGAMPVALYETLSGDRDLKELATFTASIIGNTFAFNPIPHLFKPLLEQLVNFDMFRWQAIEGMRDLGVEPELRWGAGTGPTSKALAKIIPKWANASPKRIEKLVRDYAGGSGDIMMNVLDVVTQHLDPNEDPAGTELGTLLHTFGIEGFAPSLKPGNEPSYTKYTEKYYDMLAQAEMAYNSMRHYDERLTGKALKKKEAEFAEWVEVRDILKPYQSDLRDLSNDLKDIKYSKKSRKQKLHEKDRLLKERNKVFMDAVTEARDYLKGIK